MSFNHYKYVTFSCHGNDYGKPSYMCNDKPYSRKRGTYIIICCEYRYREVSDLRLTQKAHKNPFTLLQKEIGGCVYIWSVHKHRRWCCRNWHKFKHMNKVKRCQIGAASYCISVLIRWGLDAVAAMSQAQLSNAGSSVKISVRSIYSVCMSSQQQNRCIQWKDMTRMERCRK